MCMLLDVEHGGSYTEFKLVTLCHAVSQIKKLNDDATINTQFRVLIKTVK